jgi:hypothetical protein
MTTTVVKQFNTAGGAGVDFSTWGQLQAFVNPLTPVGADTDYDIQITGNLTVPEGDTMGPSGSVDATRRVRFRAKPGQSVNDNGATVFDDGITGASLSMVRNTYHSSLPGIEIEGMRILLTGAGSQTLRLYKISRCRILDTSTNTNSSIPLVLGMMDSLYHATVAGKTLFQIEVAVDLLRNTLVAANTAKLNGYPLNDSKLDSNVFLGFAEVYNGTPTLFTNNFANAAPTSGYSTGLSVVAGANALLTNDSTDFRPKAGGPLIGAGSAAAQGTSDILGGNRGPAPDVGARQLAFVPPSPTGTITDITVNGTTITVSGTTTNSPTSGTASLTLTNEAGNNGVEQNLSEITLGSGTFTATFTNVKVGHYVAGITLTNVGGTVAAANALGYANVQGASGVLVSQSVDGQVYSISVTTSGAPTSASITIPPAAANPNGAVAVGPAAMTLGSGTATFSGSLVPGNYDPAFVTFTTANGTSFPMAGTLPAAVIGISGNPEGPPISGGGGGGGGTTIPATILVNGRVVPIPAALIGTGKKPIVYLNGRFKVRAAAEGIPVVFVNGRYRLLAAGEVLGI